MHAHAVAGPRLKGQDQAGETREQFERYAAPLVFYGAKGDADEARQQMVEANDTSICSSVIYEWGEPAALGPSCVLLCWVRWRSRRERAKQRWSGGTLCLILAEKKSGSK